MIEDIDIKYISPAGTIYETHAEIIIKMKIKTRQDALDLKEILQKILKIIED